MSHCSLGTKATVNYQFGDGTYKTYTTESTPIDVDDTGRYTPAFSGGQCPVIYKITTLWYNYEGSYNNPETFEVFGPIEGVYTVRKTDFPASPGYANFNHRIRAKDRNGLTLDQSRGGGDSNINRVFGERIEIISVVRSDGQLDNCGDPPPGCTIKVLHKGQVIFADKGKCPITYLVTCGDECPPDTVKCLKSGYPGYCCLPCSEIKAEIQTITSQVRKLNNG